MLSRFYTLPAIQTRKKPLKNDPQRYRVYAMERCLIGSSINQHMRLLHLQVIAAHACRKWHVPRVHVTTTDKDVDIFGWCTGSSIILNTSFHGDNIGVLLHELAHWVVYHFFPDVTDHGPVFMDVYADLLDQYKVFPRDCLLLLAARYDVEVGESDDET